MKEIELSPQHSIVKLNDMCNHLDCDELYILAVDEACKALDLRIPQYMDSDYYKTRKNGDYGVLAEYKNVLYCPTCGEKIEIPANETNFFCYICGQKIVLEDEFNEEK